MKGGKTLKYHKKNSHGHKDIRKHMLPGLNKEKKRDSQGTPNIMACKSM